MEKGINKRETEPRDLEYSQSENREEDESSSQ